MAAENSGISAVPSFFQYLADQKLIQPQQILSAKDGFFLIYKSIASLLLSGGIETFPDREGNVLPCRNFFDDWFLFSVPCREDAVYGLLKLREQEYELERGLTADGDTPGVTICFIAFRTDVLKACLEDPSQDNRKKLGLEINRVVAYPKQNHHTALKDYFIRPQAEGPYLVAETYVRHIASFCDAGTLRVPEAYRQICQKRGSRGKYARVPDFIDRNNRDAASQICDHEQIRLRQGTSLSPQEKLAILATHTGNLSVHSFAAEVRYHALFLTNLAKIRLPLAGSPYASAVRADMSIGDKEFQGPAPYYNLSGKMIRTQEKYHADFQWK